MMRRIRLTALPVLLGLAAGCSDQLTDPTPQPTPPSKAPAPSFAQSAPDMGDGHGLIWRQLTATTGVSWSAVAQLCPQDGVNPCWGSTGGISFNGWVWATEAQVIDLIARYAPDIRTNRLLSGVQYGPAVSSLFGLFEPSSTGSCGTWTCSFGAFVGGWTATSNAPDYAEVATFTAGFGGNPAIQVAPHSGLSVPGQLLGHFLWRIDTSDGSAVVANDDAGSIDSPNAGVVVPNVLANDLVGSTPATLSNVTIAQLSSSHPGVTLNPADGSVSVVYGLPVGGQSLTYRICETARPSNCDTAVVTVTIDGNLINAVDDAGSTKTGGGVAVANLLANDSFAGDEATLDGVTLALTSTHQYLVLGSDGSLSAIAGTPAGNHQVGYVICEIGNPTNCDQAIARVTVTAYAIDAVDDQGTAQSGPGGTAVANVLVNDTFDGRPATRAVVTMSQVSSTVPGLTLDVNTGSVNVAPATPAGYQSLVYQICEIASPANCDQATVAVTIQPQMIVVSKDRHRVKEGAGGSFTVKLSQAPTANVVVGVSYLAGTMPVGFAPPSLTFTPANWNVAQTVTFTTVRDSDKSKVDNAGTLQLTAAGVPTKLVVVNGIDGDRKLTNPVGLLQAPYNGETVSGAVAVWGTATDSDGTIADARFSVDGVRIASLVGPGGTYRFPSWNTATVANGWHEIEFRVTDDLGNDGRMTIKVFVSN